MTEYISKHNLQADSTRRQFLKKVGLGAVAGTIAAPQLEDARSATPQRKVKYRTLGKTGLRVSEIGIGGHSWECKRVPDGKGGFRKPNVDEAVRMIGKSIDLGVNFLDSCTMPYNIRHRAAEGVLPAAKKKGLGVITIKPFSRGLLLKDRDLQGAYAGLPRDMMSFVLENKHVDICTCGVHTIEQTTENLSASWTKLSPSGRERLKEIAGTCVTDREYAWLEQDWRHA